MSSAFHPLVKSMKGLQYDVRCSKKCLQASRSRRFSFISCTWWCGCNFFFWQVFPQILSAVIAYSLLVNALPGTITLPRKLGSPQICWICQTVTFLFSWYKQNSTNMRACWILSCGKQTIFCTASISSPRKMMTVCPQKVFSMDTRKFMSLQMSKNIWICWSHIQEGSKQEVIQIVQHLFSSCFNFLDVCYCIREVLKMSTTNWSPKRQAFINKKVDFPIQWRFCLHY